MTMSKPLTDPHSSLIIDGNTGNVLWKDNIDEPRDPASMSKLMTLYLLFEDMASGKIGKDTGDQGDRFRPSNRKDL